MDTDTSVGHDTDTARGHVKIQKKKKIRGDGKQSFIIIIILYR